MKYLVVLSLLFAATNAMAAKTTYVSNGKVLTAPEALRAALENKQVLGCKIVVARPNASGTSIGLKAKPNDE
jgi:hypothetical protein